MTAEFVLLAVVLAALVAAKIVLLLADGALVPARARVSRPTYRPEFELHGSD